MAAPKSTASAALAARIVRQALGHEAGSKHTIPVSLPRKDHPVYLMPTKQAQPWGLLPMKAAAYAEYPNFFSNSCTFFGSIDRDIKLGRPHSILRVSKLSLDLAKVMRNLGILGSFHIGQKLDHLGDNDYVWQEDLEPEHVSELKLYKYKYLKLGLRWDLFKPAWGSPQQTLSQTPLDVPEALPLSVVNISRPSQPVYLTPNVIKQELQRYPSGIFVMYHHQLGITTDAALGLVREPGLVMAHVGLPYSHVAQVQASLKQRLQEQQERGQAPEHALVLKSWSMVDFVQERLAERRQQLGAGPIVERQKQEIRRLVERTRKEDEALISDFDISSTLHNELLAWQLKDKLAPSPQRQWDTGDRDGRGAASESRQARGGRDDNRRGPRGGQGGERQDQGQAERQWSRSGGNRQSRGSDGGFRGRSSDPAMRRDSR